MFEHTDANLVQVFEETIENGDQISCRQLVPQDNRQLVDGEGQSAPHLPLTSKTRWVKTITKAAITSQTMHCSFSKPIPDDYCMSNFSKVKSDSYYICVALTCVSHLHISSQGFIRVLQAVPVLPTQRESHTWKTEGTVFGYFCIHCLGPGRVCHGEVLIQQLLRDHILKTGRQKFDIKNTTQYNITLFIKHF